MKTLQIGCRSMINERWRRWICIFLSLFDATFLYFFSLQRRTRANEQGAATTTFEPTQGLTDSQHSASGKFIPNIFFHHPQPSFSSCKFVEKLATFFYFFFQSLYYSQRRASAIFRRGKKKIRELIKTFDQMNNFRKFLSDPTNCLCC